MTLVLYIADSLPFAEGLSLTYTINMKYYLSIAIVIAETQEHFFFIIIQFQHIAFMFTENDIIRTRKLEVNKQFTDWIKEFILKQNEKSYVHVPVPCHAILEQTVKYKWFLLKF